MAQYKGKQSVMDEALGEYKDKGYRLEEAENHTYTLYFKDKWIWKDIPREVTFEAIQEGCKTHAANTMREV